MKKRIVLLCMLLVGSMSIVGCSSSNKKAENTNKTEDSRNSKDDSNKNQNPQNNQGSGNGQAPQNDALAKGELTEEDIVKKSKENIDGKDVVKYELKDGSVVIGTEGEADLNELNDSIKNKKGESQDF